MSDRATSPWHPDLVVIDGTHGLHPANKAMALCCPTRAAAFNIVRRAPLGLRVALATPFSDDVFGQRLQALARADGVRACLPPSRAPRR